MKWTGITLGVAMFSGVTGWRNLVVRGKSSVSQAVDTEFPSDRVFSHRVPSNWNLESTTRLQVSSRQVEQSDEYARLRELLITRRYDEADQETWRLMLRIAGVHQRGYFEIRDFEEFPIIVLRTLDRLWLDASEGRLGLSVQRRIYREEDRQYDRLGSRLGWVMAGKWLTAEHHFDPQEIPEGHMPSALWRAQLASFGFFGLGMCLEVFLSREDW